jgi:hypothetical protein
MNGNGIESLLKTIRAQKARCRCILLAENIQQQQEARAAGVDVVLLLMGTNGGNGRW